MDTRKTDARTQAMEKIEAMIREISAFDGMMTTDCVILWRGERIDGSAVRARFHPLGPMDDLRERGLIEQARDDIADEDRLRR